jgi:hypothetical protein
LRKDPAPAGWLRSPATMTAGIPGDATKPDNRRGIVATCAVAVELDPLGDETSKVITGARTLGMTCQPHLLPTGNPSPRGSRSSGRETRSAMK